MGFSSKPGKKDPIDFRMLYNQFFEHFNGLTSLFCSISSHRHLTADQAFLFSSCSGRFTGFDRFPSRTGGDGAVVTGPCGGRLRFGRGSRPSDDDGEMPAVVSKVIQAFMPDLQTGGRHFVWSARMKQPSHEVRFPYIGFFCSAIWQRRR